MKAQELIKEGPGDDEKIVAMIQNLKHALYNHDRMSEHPSLHVLDQLEDDLRSGEPVKAEADGLQPADLKRLGQSEPNVYVHKDGKTILIPKRKHNEYLAKGWKTSSLRAETQTYESKLVDKLNQRLK